MRLHEQLGGPEPDDEVRTFQAELEQRRQREEQCNYYLDCPDCGMITSDGEYCGECLSQRAEYFIPDEGV
jgi:hypothetical protein